MKSFKIYPGETCLTRVVAETRKAENLPENTIKDKNRQTQKQRPYFGYQFPVRKIMNTESQKLKPKSIKRCPGGLEKVPRRSWDPCEITWRKICFAQFALFSREVCFIISKYILRSFSSLWLPHGLILHRNVFTYLRNIPKLIKAKIKFATPEKSQK